ncbi:MAG TPA: hypothetical protein P5191_01625 [Ruminococcus sp.]|nr:hypothetical protein [Ruminococcus sp.]
MALSFKIIPALFLSAFLFSGCSETGQDSSGTSSAATAAEVTADSSALCTEAETILAENINEPVVITDTDGSGMNYEFCYGDMTFQAEYTPDNWKIRDSYRIDDRDAMREICAALLEIHPIHGADMSSYRTADDMAYEWDQHNIAYRLLPDDSPLKESAADVDLNPEDQGKDIIDFFLDRVG